MGALNGFVCSFSVGPTCVTHCCPFIKPTEITGIHSFLICISIVFSTKMKKRKEPERKHTCDTCELTYILYLICEFKYANIFNLYHKKVTYMLFLCLNICWV